MNSLPIIGNILVPMISPLITSWLGSGANNRNLSASAIFVLIGLACLISLILGWVTWWVYFKIYGYFKLDPIKLGSKKEADYAKNVKWQSVVAGAGMATFIMLNVLGVVIAIRGH